MIRSKLRFRLRSLTPAPREIDFEGRKKGGQLHAETKCEVKYVCFDIVRFLFLFALNLKMRKSELMSFKRITLHIITSRSCLPAVASIIV